MRNDASQVSPPPPLVVYSCVVGRYDLPLPPPPARGGGIRFVYFTDDPPKVRGAWESRPLQSSRRLRDGHDINRFHKLFPHRLFPQHRYSIYLDGNIRYDTDIKALLKPLKATGAALGAFRHPNRRTLGEEARFCRDIGKFDRHDLGCLEAQLRLYSEGLGDLDRPIPANYLLVRDHHHPTLPTAMSLWWSHLFEFTKRDQISLLYALDRCNLPWVFLDDHTPGLERSVVRLPHRRSLWSRGRRVVRRLRKGLPRRGRDGSR